jgi:hypothetical protein
MDRYKKGKELEDHGLGTIFSRYDSRQETEFVAAFFEKIECNSILEKCGLSQVEEFDRELEHQVQIGYSTKRADLVFEGPDDSVYYFEVMSQSGDGRWDDAHHQQFYLKSTRLSQIYENVYAFAIAFKEFDPQYLEEISRVDNWYAIHLRFNDHGYFVDVYGVEQKKQKQATKNLEKEELGIRLLEMATAFGWKNRSDKPISSNYLFVGKGWEGKKYRGIEWVLSSRPDRMGIKLHGQLYKEEPFRTINMNPESIVSIIEEKVPGVKFLPFGAKLDRAYYFEFDKTDLSDTNIAKLRSITEIFAEIFKIESLLK